MNIKKCSACGGDHKDVSLVIEKRIDGERWFVCPQTDKKVYVMDTESSERNNKFECCFELPHKGIYFEAESNETHFEISMFDRSKFLTSVCLHDEEVERLRDMLNEHLSRERK